ncbi:hypothetical protein NFI95_15505 [Acetobacteraceae bacterium KSS8]|uniref:Uncharacterized protein n=1 Tax=Endosaccharibacter trunci TaxID=2812733 RepID=A0ABT1WAD2_9PROT|nr:hypothetical protein [Acetobacteraceae bacterium KSS8]
MAVGDPGDFAQRLRALLPNGWFPAAPAQGSPETAPVLMAVLTAIGTGLSQAWSMLTFANAQTRISTSTGDFVDAIAADFFGPGGLDREPGETDATYIARIKASLFPIRTTRAAVLAALARIGLTATIVEPRNSGDTKGRGSISAPAAGGGYGYGTPGLCYGSMLYPFQALISVDNASAGVQGSAVRAAVLPVLPAGSTAWLNLTAP